MDKTANYDASLDAAMEERNHTEIIRKEDKITGYKFRILVRDKPALEGVLSRDEMDMIYRLYTNDGAGFTQREVSREFGAYTFQEFKKILRAFNITKASAPFAPHMIEEYTTDKLTELQFERKERDYLKKYELNRHKLFEKRYYDLLEQHIELKQSVLSFEEFISELKIDSPANTRRPVHINNKTLILYMSDMHIGADVSKLSLFENSYDEQEVHKRIDLITDHILAISDMYNINHIVVCNLGDSLDGYNGHTTRGGHLLPQNLNNKDQFRVFLKAMTNLFSRLSTSDLFNTIKYYSVEGGNHDGDFGYVANQALIASLDLLDSNIHSQVFDRYIGTFEVNNHTFMISHGKDAKDMFRNYPLVLNDKVENQINEFINYNKLSGNIHFIKGDLHQSATTYGKNFRYKSVGSFFGSSEWIHKNFGNTLPVVDFDILLDDIILESQIKLTN